MSVKSKRINYIFIGGIILLFIGMILLWNLQSEKSQLSEKTVELSQQLTMLEKQAADKNIDLNIEKSEHATEQEESEIIITKERVDGDEVLAKEFFTPAFDWTSGEQYDEMREQYVSLLGENSSFVDTYIVENIKIETNEGELSYIDQKELRSKMHSLTAIPVEIEEDRIQYVAFIVHYMHKDQKDLVNLDALDKSEVIVEFTISGDENSSNRKIEDVEAWNLS
ncbi:hypothetical protein JYK21_08840 [Ralstonia pickettii]|nr:hypothetical protein [Ralstonia pickettii]